MFFSTVHLSVDGTSLVLHAWGLVVFAGSWFGFWDGKQNSIPYMWQVILIWVYSLMVLTKLDHSLAIMLKSSTIVLWPVLGWWSYMSGGVLRCSSNPKVMGDCPVYSSLQSNLMHQYQYITPLFCFIVPFNVLPLLKSLVYHIFHICFNLLENFVIQLYVCIYACMHVWMHTCIWTYHVYVYKYLYT